MDLVLLLAVDIVSMSDMVLFQSLVGGLRLHSLWLVCVERRNILRRYLWQSLPKGIERFASASGKMAK